MTHDEAHPSVFGAADGWPSLAHLREDDQQVSMDLSVRLILGAFGEDPPGETALLLNLAQHSDQAIREYEQARRRCEAVREHFSDDGVLQIGAIFQTLDHIETCVTAAHRALLHAGVLGARGAEPWDVTWWDASEPGREALRVMRNAIQHRDEHVDKLLDRGRRAAVPRLWIAADHFWIDHPSKGDLEMRYADLAQHCADAHRLAVDLVNGSLPS